jgi:nitric oxide reductase subunit B
MLEIVILAKLLLDVVKLLGLRVMESVHTVPLRFMRAATYWTFAMLTLAMLISFPPLNALIHGTHMVPAHVMGSMIGIDSMILWACLSVVIHELVGVRHPVATGRRVRAAVPLVNGLFTVFLITYLVRGWAAGWTRQLGPSAPDYSRLVALFPPVMAIAGAGLALTVFWMIGCWVVALVGGSRPQATTAMGTQETNGRAVSGHDAPQPSVGLATARSEQD